MPTMNAVEQARYFQHQLGSTLPSIQVEAFKKDLRRVNLDYMDAALKKINAVSKKAGKPLRDARRAVWLVYNQNVRKVATLFPVFFVHESAWRTISATVLAIHYGNDFWWSPIRSAILAGQSTANLTAPNGLPFRPAVLNTVAYIVGSQTVEVSCSSYGLMAQCTLKNVEDLVEAHWSDFAALFHAQPHTALTLSVFLSKFSRVRRARNDAYHHRMVAEQAKALKAAEELLDLLDIHLQTCVDDIAAVAGPTFAYNVLREVRHS